MAELIFIATTIFVAYVIFTVTDDKKTKSEPNKTETPKPVVVAEPVEVKVEPKAEKPAPAKAKPATAKPVAAKPATKVAKPKAAAKPKAVVTVAPVASTEVPSDSLRNPKTGEVVKIPNSYAFAKRWVKDALVEEGLLDKIYKNNELDNEANAKIQVAIEQLKQMAKYH